MNCSQERTRASLKVKYPTASSLQEVRRSSEASHKEVDSTKSTVKVEGRSPRQVHPILPETFLIPLSMCRDLFKMLDECVKRSKETQASLQVKDSTIRLEED
jgi:hypothetical protein